MLFDINCSNVYLDPLPRVMKIKTNEQMRPNQTYRLFNSEGDHKQSKKDNPQNGRKYQEMM